ncbi:hypothetical protein M378DRAFT_183246 [Amanita muscaria Koide BX008]|uniref:Autophagy-related protein 16 domain-containing protein n=1 Tax=Amanita muscaria (strain Koide BX008) TaxID=946122 RepID=A0A0C2X8D7_AMAMK|nr:hypothetical protein M378DRAFT_183246 [Amanita muscaria Koide BX008]
MAEPSWQEQLRLRLVERNAREATFKPIIEQYRRLAQQTKLLKERNTSLLRAVAAVKASGGNAASSGTLEENPVLTAFTQSLELQISSLRDELAAVYKTHGQNAQRLLAMNETLREREEMSRVEAENLRKAKEEITVLRRKVDQHGELMSEKDRTVQILHDEISTLQLELGQIDERNQTLQKDNAKLLQRWLDAKQAEANKLNEANEYYETMRSRDQAVVNWRNGTSSDTPPATQNGVEHTQPSSTAGKGLEKEESRSTMPKDNTPSPSSKTMDLNPNG